jgi:hypothetical protein
MKTTKKHRFKNVNNAARRVRELEKRIEEYEEICTRLELQKLLLARLAATTPQFSNPLAAMAAEQLRDEILARRS